MPYLSISNINSPVIARHLLAAISLLVSIPAYPNKITPNIRLTTTRVPGAELRLEARQAPLAQILKEIAKRTDTRIHYSVLPEAPVTATCVGASVKQIMNCLVGSQLGLVAQSAEQNAPDEFWVLGSSVGSCQAMTLESAAPLTQEISDEAEPTPEEQMQAEQAMQEQSERLLEQAKTKDPKQRAEAIANLASSGVKDDPNIRRVLEESLSDKDAQVRAQAIATLAKREGEGAADALRQAYRDQDSNVRLMAVDHAGNDASLLQQAMTDKDPMIRQYAATKLEALTKASRRN